MEAKCLFRILGICEGSFTILLPLLGFLKSSYKFFDGFFEIRYDLIWRIVVKMYYTTDNVFVIYKRYFNPQKQN